MSDGIKLANGSIRTQEQLIADYKSGNRPKYTVDTDWFMNEGPGRYTHPGMFAGVVDLLAGNIHLAPGTYNLVKKPNDPNGIDPNALFNVGTKAGQML